MKKEIKDIIIDGEKHKISDDQKFIVGPTKKYSIEEFREEKKGKIPFMIIPPDTIDKENVYGFSTQKKFEDWLEKVNLMEHYKTDKKIIEKAKKEKTKEEHDKIMKSQKEEVDKATKKFEDFLKSHNIKASDVDKIQKFIEEHDPHYPPPFGSLQLFEHVWWGGVQLVLPGGYWSWFKFYPRSYPDLSQWNFDNKVSSFSIWWSTKAILFDGKNYTGAWLVAYGPYADLTWYLWNDKISSAIVY